MVLKGLLAAGITMGVAAVFPEALVFPFLVAVLGLFLGVYPGIALAEPVEGRAGVQWTIAVALLIMGLVGLWASPLLLGVAWLLHGLWAVSHRLNRMEEAVPEGLPAFSLSYSLVMASFIGYMWVMGP